MYPSGALGTASPAGEQVLVKDTGMLLPVRSPRDGTNEGGQAWLAGTVSSGDFR